MDASFKNTKINNNIPMMLALISIWNISTFLLKTFAFVHIVLD